MSTEAESLTCTVCGATFTLSQAVRDKYPGWKPKTCMKCRPAKAGASTTGRAGASGTGAAKAKRPAPPKAAYAGDVAVEENLTLAEVLAKYTEGPTDGVFTDGSAVPNPGPGGWGAVYVVDGQVVAQRHGHDPATTNNRMELTALIHAYELVPPGTKATIYSDSNLAVQTVNEWAASWERNGWKRKTGPIQNLDLVQELYARAKQRPELKLQWIKAHAGSRWNEYADALATAWMRDEL
ncbi:ribonuclease HI [Myxococcota bacterium]|nr:ribonuclease HI [Myxococcota bacterium]